MSKEETRNVHQRLSDARAKFHALELKKSGHNKFAGYTYFELGDFLIPAMGVLRDQGLGTTPVAFDGEYATMSIVNLADPQDRINLQSPMGSAALKGCHEVQNIGAVQTYQRRYLWVNAMEIVEHDALDATTGDKANPPAKEYAFPDGPARNITDLKNQVRGLWREINSCGDADELHCLLEVPANKALIEQASKLENPSHRELWEGDGKDNPGLRAHIENTKMSFNTLGAG